MTKNPPKTPGRRVKKQKATRWWQITSGVFLGNSPSTSTKAGLSTPAHNVRCDGDEISRLLATVYVLAVLNVFANSRAAGGDFGRSCRRQECAPPNSGESILDLLTQPSPPKPVGQLVDGISGKRPPGADLWSESIDRPTPTLPPGFGKSSCCVYQHSVAVFCPHPACMLVAPINMLNLPSSSWPAPFAIQGR